MKIEYLGCVGYKDGRELNGFLLSTYKDISSIKLSGKKLVLLGVGIDSFYTEELLKYYDLQIYGYADNSPKLKGKMIRGKKILKPDDFFQREEVHFIISTHDNNIFGARLQLMAHGIYDYSVFILKTSYMYQEDPAFRTNLMNAINYICFENETIESALPYISYASGAYGGKLGNTNWLLTSSEWHHHACLWIRDILANIPNGKVLDIGPGFGLISEIMMGLYPDISMTWLLFKGEDRDTDEFNKALNKISSQYDGRVKMKYGMIEMENNLLDDNYDLIIMTEVFEHFAVNPISTMIKLRDRLSENGRIALTTPNWKALYTYKSWSDLPQEDSISMERYMELLHCGHVYQYSKDELYEIFNKSGLIVDKYALSISGNHNLLLKRGN